jgi:hypothetical protein
VLVKHLHDLEVKRNKLFSFALRPTECNSAQTHLT